MPINSLLVLDLTLGYLESIDRRPPLARPSLRDSILTKLVAVSRLLKAHFEPLLYSEVFISEGNKQMRPLIKSLRANYGYKSHLVTKLSFVSRHREVDMWSTRSVESIVSRCCAVRRLVIAIPTLFGLDPELLFADSLKGPSLSRPSLDSEIALMPTALLRSHVSHVGYSVPTSL